MIKLFEIIFYGHAHHWEIIERCNVGDGWGGRGSRYYLQCKTCGNVKKEDFI